MAHDSLTNQLNTRLEAEVREYERRKQEEREAKKRHEESVTSADSNHKSS